MENQADNTQAIGEFAVISDHAACLQALLPEIVRVVCYGLNGQPFWQSQPDTPILMPDSYQQALTQILASPKQNVAVGPLKTDQATGYLVPLRLDKDRLLGVLSILVSPEAEDLSIADCVNTLHPALRSLQRELILRFQLVEGRKKLGVQSSEEQLLHKVEQLVHQRKGAKATLSAILKICCQHLAVESAALVVPDKRIRIIEGRTLGGVEASLVLDDLIEKAESDSGFFGDTGRDVYASAEADMLSLQVRQDASQSIGVLAFSGWSGSDFSMPRRRRVAHYVVSQIEQVIGRDYDALTGLMSWPLFETKLMRDCGKSDNDEHIVLYLDIDQLHVMNDSLGHDAGDEILTKFSKLIRDRLDSHPVARITSDSFASYIVDGELDFAREIAEDICRSFNEVEYVQGGQTYRPSVSIGVSAISGKPKTGTAALSTAKVACQAAKDRGRGRVEVYQSEDASIIQRFDDIKSVGQIRNSIENDQVVLLAQPIVPLNKQTATRYYEVLVRLLDENGRQVLPAEFLSAAERYQLMEELDRWVVSETLRMVSSYARDLQGRPIRFAMNLSGQSLGSEKFLPFVQEEIRKSGVAADTLCFEITETVAVANMQRAQAFMHELKKLGCRFSLDDFGTGLSSFAYLKLFPVDTLKIDGSFVRDVSTNVVSQSVVAAISEVARVMELETVAEYVQDEASLKLLRDLGVTYGQGFLLGKPESLREKLDIIAMSPDPTGDTSIAALPV